MRRTTVHRRPVVPRDHRARDEADERRERPEVRGDIRRTWWPDAPSGPADGIRRR